MGVNEWEDFRAGLGESLDGIHQERATAFALARIAIELGTDPGCGVEQVTRLRILEQQAHIDTHRDIGLELHRPRTRKDWL